jgi:hypothetical protein
MASGTPRKKNLRVGLILLAAILLYMGALIGYMITR